MTETEKWINESLKNIPHLCAEVRRLSEENDSLRARLKKEVNIPNAPLTPEELQEMDGEPVFCFSKRAAEDSAYGIVCIRDSVPYVRTIQNKGTLSRFFYLTTYGTAWMAYHRKPEEVSS